MTLFGEAGTLGSIPIILIYLLTNLALPVYMLGTIARTSGPSGT